MPSSRKITVGIFVAGGVLLFTLGLFWIGDRRLMFERSIELYTEFARLSGLKIGSKVLVGGMDAGEVLGIEVPAAPDARFRVRFRVLEKFQPILRSDSQASIQVEGLVGSMILQVSAGTAEGVPVHQGDTIPGRDPVEISEVMQEAVETIQQARVAVDEIRGGANDVMGRLMEISKQTGEVIDDLGGDLRKITQTGGRVAEDVEAVIQGIQDGRGTVGKLMTDDQLYETMRGTVRSVEATVKDLQETSADMKQIAADLRASDLPGMVGKTVENIEEITEKGKVLIAGMLPEGPREDGMGTSLRQTLNNAEQAMATLAENMEALQHNWLFRGYFRGRGFFNMEAVSLADYQAGKFAPDRVRKREWISAGALFHVRADGTEELTEAGRKKLDEAMAGFLRYAANNPIMVEGYASEGTPDEQFLRSLERASLARNHLVSRFRLRPNYVGVMPMGAVETVAADGTFWNGVSVVLFLPRDLADGSK